MPCFRFSAQPSPLISNSYSPQESPQRSTWPACSSPRPSEVTFVLCVPFALWPYPNRDFSRLNCLSFFLRVALSARALRQWLPISFTIPGLGSEEPPPSRLGAKGGNTAGAGPGEICSHWPTFASPPPHLWGGGRSWEEKHCPNYWASLLLGAWFPGPQGTGLPSSVGGATLGGFTLSLKEVFWKPSF